MCEVSGTVLAWVALSHGQLLSLPSSSYDFTVYSVLTLRSCVALPISVSSTPL